MRIRILLLSLAVLCSAALLWWFRPWADYSPSIMTRLFHPDHRVVNFRSMQAVFPYRTLAASDTPRPLPRAADGGLPQQFVFNGNTVSVAEFLARTETTGLMVLHNGSIRHEQYFLGTTASDRLTSWSMAKTVVSTLAAMALAEGHIGDIDDTVADYIPALANEAYGAVPIRDLLRMASGIDFDETYHSHFSDINQLFYRVFLFGHSVNNLIARLPASRPPGEAFHYISPNSQMLAWVVSAATGMPISAYAEQALWQPLGMEDEAFWNLDQHGNELAFCCLNLTLRDYAKLGQLYLQQGSWHGHQLLPPGWVQEATRRPEPWLAAGHGYDERGYGYHLWVPVAPEGEYFFNGVWGQTIWVSEPQGVVVVKTSVDPEFRPHTAEMIAFMRALTAYYETHASPESP